jgi:Ca-activated chloride channel homolog
MPWKVFLKSRIPRLAPPVLLLLLCSTALPAFAQTAPTQQPQPQSSKPVTQFDPTKPETQPSLTVDRDPVLSIDPEDNIPVGSLPPPVATGPAGQIQKGKNGIYTLHEDVNEVLLNCTVVDEKKRVVDGLLQNDFRVWEDGSPQAINSFAHQDLPVSMGILIDNSGSMHDKRAAVNAAALTLVKASNPRDEAFIVNFSDKAYLDQGFTSSISLLEQGLSHYDTRSMTALYDAVVASADELSRQAKQQKQVLLIVTDGADNASRLTLEQAARRVQRLGGPEVYSIALLFGVDKEEANQAKSDLETLSRDTGGIAYFADSLQDVDTIAREVAQDIRDQYTIGYHSPKAANLGGYRRVRVEAESPNYKNLIVRTSPGYYPSSVRRSRVQQTAQATPNVPKAP